jgi:NAD(P)H-flavin reductase
MARVEEVEPQGVWAVHITLQIEGSAAFRHEAGQYVTLDLDRDGIKRGRHYSIACPPRTDNRIELCIERAAAAGGLPGPAPLALGDRLRLSGPHGTYRLRQPVDRDCLFVATGTGVSPLRAMLHQALGTTAERTMTLLFGTRAEDSLLFREEFAALAAREPRFRYRPTLSRPGAGWTGLTGYVQTHFDRILGGARDWDVYVCGRKVMVEAAVAELAARGFASGQVHFEQYG